MNCTNCLHYNDCLGWVGKEDEERFLESNSPEKCDCFDNKELYVKLPCKRGDRLYIVLRGTNEVLLGTVRKLTFSDVRGIVVNIAYIKNGHETTGNFTSNSFGKTVFYTEQEAIVAASKNSEI